MVAWYETTLDESFLEKEADNYDQLSTDEQNIFKGRLSVWNDVSSSTGTRNNATQTTEANRPLYLTNCINSLPCIRFREVGGTNTYFDFDGSKIGNVSGSDYTIFIVEKKEGTIAGPASIIGSSLAGSETLSFGYSDNDTISWSHGNGTTDNATTDSDLQLEDNNAVLHVIINENKKDFGATANDNFFYYANGNNTPQTLTSNGNGIAGAAEANKFLPSYDNASIATGYRGGNQTFYTGSIGEIIIYSKSLKTDERDAVEEYLIKKWQIKPDNS